MYPPGTLKSGDQYLPNATRSMAPGNVRIAERSSGIEVWITGRFGDVVIHEPEELL
jgi:hypothetical protein